MTSANVTILVVEDEPLVSMSIVAHLRDDGFRVLEAANADEAIAILEQDEGVRLIFTDIDMPGSMDGLKLAAAVRRRWPPVHIIVTSGQRSVAADDLPDGSLFFAKPYHHAEITNSVRQMLG